MFDRSDGYFYSMLYISNNKSMKQALFLLSMMLPLAATAQKFEVVDSIDVETGVICKPSVNPVLQGSS